MSLRWFLFSLVSLPLCALAQDPDADMLAAHDAARASDKANLEALAPRLAGYVLEPYVDYWRLKLSIDEAEPSAIQDFLARNRDTVLAERLRVEWLKSLAMRHEWTLFGAEYSLAHSEDAELACFTLQYRRQLSERALAEARPLWFSAHVTPPSCEPLFDEMFMRGDLGEDDIWKRFRLATDAGNVDLAMRLDTALDTSKRIPLVWLKRAERDPEHFLRKRGIKLRARARRELLVFALTREAARTPASAHKHLLKWKSTLTLADRTHVGAQIAFHGARELLPEALDWYRELGVVFLTDSQLAWKARSALRALAWQDVEAAIDAMSLKAQRDGAWRYWKARALREQGRGAEAEAVFASLAQQTSFYGLLAGEELGRALKPKLDPVKVQPEALAAFERKPSVQRALKLFELGMRAEGVSEWVWSVHGLDDNQLLAAAEVARRKGLYDRAINTADRTVALHDFTLRYLVPYRSVFDAATRTNGLDEAFVLGVVRQESRFIADAISSAGAVGLMQLMPPTARWSARKLGRSDYRPSHIALVDVNIELGTFYLRYVLDRSDGLPALAAAAYNAGPTRARAWRATQPLEGAIYVESIPFNETRNYVKKVLANVVFYAQILGGPQVTLKQRLGVVPPRDSKDRSR